MVAHYASQGSLRTPYRVCSLDGATHGVNDELHAVADSEHRELVLLAVFEKAVGNAWGTLDVDAVWAARENDSTGVGAGNALLLWPVGVVVWREPGETHHGGVAGHKQRAHARFTHTPCDELRILRSIIQDEHDRVALEHVGRAVGISPSGGAAATVCKDHDEWLHEMLYMYTKLGAASSHVLRQNDVPRCRQMIRRRDAGRSEQ